MANRERNVGINIRVTLGEKRKIESSAKKCKPNVSEYIRQVATGTEPKALPAKEIEDSFLRLQSVIQRIDRDKRFDSDPVSRYLAEGYEKDIYKILVETLQLMRDINPKSEVSSHGNN